MQKKFNSRGYTLVEIMVAVLIFGFLMTGVTSFFISSFKSMNGSNQRMNLAAQIKKFSNELIVQASRSNQFVLFKSPTSTDFDTVVTATDGTMTFPDRQTIVGDETTSAALHPAGDLAIFVYYQIPKATSQDNYLISKLEGYFLSTASAGSPGTVQKVVIDLSSVLAASPTIASSPIETILTAKWNLAATAPADPTRAIFTTYFPIVRGLAQAEAIDGVAVPVATPSPGRLFYMSASRNVIISGQIFSGNKNINTNDTRTYTNAFSFNITPRS